MLSISVALWLLSGRLFPRVEDPWPDTVGLELPIVMAGAGGVVAGALRAGASKAQRDEAVRSGGLLGFGVGALLYVISLLSQIISGL